MPSGSTVEPGYDGASASRSAAASDERSSSTVSGATWQHQGPAEGRPGCPTSRQRRSISAPSPLDRGPPTLLGSARGRRGGAGARGTAGGQATVRAGVFVARGRGADGGTAEPDCRPPAPAVGG